MTVFLLTLLYLVITVSSKAAGNNYIVNGQNVSITTYPFVASLEVYDYFLCGASIIASNWVLTAAHCMINLDVDLIQIRVGSSYPKRDGKLVGIKEVYCHPNVDISTRPVVNDICVLRLKEKLNFTENIGSIKLPSHDADYDEDMMATALGFGLTEKWKPSDMLMAVNISIINLATCKNQYDELDFDITDDMICAGSNGKGACLGDSGGPLVQNNEVIGIVSFGIYCNTYTYPGGYTKVSSFVKWITNIIN